MILEKPLLEKFADFHEHKYVVEITDPSSNLHAYIAIHNNNLGSATGGTRVFVYKDQDEAITDVLRLSRAMTYKCALAGVSNGGGKGVIMVKSIKDKTPKMLKAYAEAINGINQFICEYTTGEDVGLDNDDVNYMRKYSPHIVGTKTRAGDPSPFAALSTYYAIKSAIKFVKNKTQLKGLTVAIKGIGKVGSTLVELLSQDEVEIYVADIDQERTNAIANKYKNVKVVMPDKISRLAVDVYSPCAMGREFTKENVARVKAHIICGAANNQLSDDSVGEYLFRKNIWYVPDYVANAGGLINVVGELEKDGYKKERVLNKIENVSATVEKILTLSQKKRIAPNKVADVLAEEIYLGK